MSYANMGVDNSSGSTSTAHIYNLPWRIPMYTLKVDLKKILGVMVQKTSKWKEPNVRILVKRKHQTTRFLSVKTGIMMFSYVISLNTKTDDPSNESNKAQNRTNILRSKSDTPRKNDPVAAGSWKDWK